MNEQIIKDNTDAKQFEMQVDGHLVRIEYLIAGNAMYLTHTEVPVELEGQGLGSKIVKGVLQEIRDRKMELVPMCPFVAAYMKRHPEWKPLLKEGFNI